MPVLIATLFALLFLPAALLAAPICDGTDFATTLSDAERQEIRTAVEAVPYAQGNHWIARRGDQTLHVIGTLHLNDPRMEAIADRLSPLLDQAELLMMEVSAEDMNDFNSLDNMSAYLLTEGPSLIELMGEKDWADFSTVLREHQIAPWMAAKMRPWLLDQVLTLPTCIRIDKQASAGLDMRLDAIAKSRDLPVASLERMEELIGIMNAKPLDQQVKELLVAVPLYDNSADYLATLREGYFSEDLAFHMEVLHRQAKEQSQLPGPEWDQLWDDFQTSLVKNRNALWLPRILDRNEATIVIAVGAAHLSGEHGLLNLLGQEGYRLERAAF